MPKAKLRREKARPRKLCDNAEEVISMLKWLQSLFQRPPALSVDFLVVGIGNVGEKYHDTRHNIGFMAADCLAGRLESARRFESCEAQVVTGTLGGHMVAIAKPTTFVNRSGRSVQLLLQKYRLTPSCCLVMIDDFNINLGTLRLRRQGSSGGHNGLKSIIASVGKEFPRLRIGVGPLAEGESVIDFVLGKFQPSEQEQKSRAIEKAALACVSFFQNGIDRTMNEFNK